MKILILIFLMLFSYQLDGQSRVMKLESIFKNKEGISWRNDLKKFKDLSKRELIQLSKSENPHLRFLSYYKLVDEEFILFNKKNFLRNKILKDTALITVHDNTGPFLRSTGGSLKTIFLLKDYKIDWNKKEKRFIENYILKNYSLRDSRINKNLFRRTISRLSDNKKNYLRVKEYFKQGIETDACLKFYIRSQFHEKDDYDLVMKYCSKNNNGLFSYFRNKPDNRAWNYIENYSEKRLSHCGHQVDIILPTLIAFSKINKEAEKTIYKIKNGYRGKKCWKQTYWKIKNRQPKS